MKLTFNGDINHDLLRQELEKVLGVSDWHLEGSTGTVTFVSGRDYPLLISPEIPAVEEVLAVSEVPAEDEVLYDSTTDPVTEYKPAVAYVPAVEYVAPVPAVPAVYGPDPVVIIQAHIDGALGRKQEVVWTKIKAERDLRQLNGVKVGANWFHSDLGSRIQQLGLVMLGSSIPPGTQWKTLGGTFVPMTQTLAQQIFGSTAASDMIIFAAAEAHRAAMMLLEDPTNYDFSAGWPEAYRR